MSETHLKRVRKICLALPGATEKLSHGEPTFFVRKKVFCMIANDPHGPHGGGRVGVWVPAPLGLQTALIEASPKTFFQPPYVGGRGWVGIDLERIGDGDLASHIHDAWRLIAPKKLSATFDAESC